MKCWEYFTVCSFEIAVISGARFGYLKSEDLLMRTVVVLVDTHGIVCTRSVGQFLTIFEQVRVNFNLGLS